MFIKYEQSEIEYLIDLGRNNFNRITKAITNSDNPKDDKNDWIALLDNFKLENSLSRFWQLDTLSRDNLLYVLKEEFSFITKSEMLALSSTLLNYMNMLNNTRGILPPSVTPALDNELRDIKGLNDMLCSYAAK